MDSRPPPMILIGRENFALWKLAMQALLHLKDLWGCIIGNPLHMSIPGKDSLARTLIMLSIKSSNYVYIQETRTSKEAWQALESVFGDSPFMRKLAILRNLVPSQLMDFTYLEDYINNIMTSSWKLRHKGFVVTEEWIGLQLLGGLTKDFADLIDEVDIAGVNIDGDTIKPMLLRFAIENDLINKVFKQPVPQEKKEESTKSSSDITPENMFEDPKHCIGDIYGDATQYVLDNIFPGKSVYDNTIEWITKSINDWNQSVATTSQQGQSSAGNSGAEALPPSSSIKQDDLEVEVRDEQGGYHEAFITDVFDDHVEVKFDYECQIKTKFAFGDVRFPPKNVLKPELHEGAEIEVYTRASEDTPWGWWKGLIDRSMSNGYVIVKIPFWLGSNFDHGECVPLDRVRLPNENPPIDRQTFYKREIAVPEEQRESAKQENVHKDFQRAIGAAICRYVPERGVLLLISRNENLNRLSSWLDEMHFGIAPEALCFLKMNNPAEPSCSKQH